MSSMSILLLFIVLQEVAIRKSMVVSLRVCPPLYQVPRFARDLDCRGESSRAQNHSDWKANWASRISGANMSKQHEIRKESAIQIRLFLSFVFQISSSTSTSDIQEDGFSRCFLVVVLLCSSAGLLACRKEQNSHSVWTICLIISRLCWPFHVVLNHWRLRLSALWRKVTFANNKKSVNVQCKQ